MTERAPVLDEATVKFGLLMESAQAHQKMAESHLEKLRAHTQDLDGVVREEIRRTLIEELAELTDESRRAVQALGAMKRAAQLRGLLWSLSAVLLSTIIPGAVAYWLLPSTSEINAATNAARPAAGEHSTARAEGEAASSGGIAVSRHACAFASIAPLRRTAIRPNISS